MDAGDQVGDSKVLEPPVPARRIVLPGWIDRALRGVV